MSMSMAYFLKRRPRDYINLVQLTGYI